MDTRASKFENYDFSEYVEARKVKFDMVVTIKKYMFAKSSSKKREILKCEMKRKSKHFNLRFRNVKFEMLVTVNTYMVAQNNF